MHRWLLFLLDGSLQGERAVSLASLETGPCWGEVAACRIAHTARVSVSKSSQELAQSGSLNHQIRGVMMSHDKTRAATGGRAVCWGANGQGRLGNNSTVASYLPVPVDGLTSGVQSIAVGGAHSCGPYLHPRQWPCPMLGFQWLRSASCWNCHRPFGASSLRVMSCAYAGFFLR